MIKVFINDEKVICNKDFTIKEEMLNTPSVILNNVYPQSWETTKDYTTNFYHPQDYSKCKIIDSSLPKEYTEVDYIETNSGNCYIDTGLTGDNTTRIIMDITPFSVINNRHLLGNIFLSNRAMSFNIRSDGQNAISRWGNQQLSSSTLAFVANRKYHIDVSKDGYFANAERKWLPTANTFTTEGNIYILNVKNSGGYGSGLYGRLYYCKIYKSGVLVRDYVPCYRDSDGVVGLYDKVNGTFNVNKGSGTLSKGNIVNSSLLFCGIVKNSGNISLNPREPHYSTLQILDFKTFLSEGETLDRVIANKTILEAIEMIIGIISDYGFVKGKINIKGANDVIGAYSTENKTAYDVFNYIADITQSRWTTRMVDENKVAIDFYDPNTLPQGTQIDYTSSFFDTNLIDEMTYSYNTQDYRNKQVMTSNEVYGNISQTQSFVADGYTTQYITEQKIGQIVSIQVNGEEKTFATNNEKQIGYTADFYYSVGNNMFDSASTISLGSSIVINYVPIIRGRQIVTNNTEINRIEGATNRKGVVARYENRSDATTNTELRLIGESYIRFKGQPEILLTIKSRKNLWNVGNRVYFDAPIQELEMEYMVKEKQINYITSIDTIFYTYVLTSSFNSESAINYFDNQRAKNNGNIGENEFVDRNVDFEDTANIIFYDTTTTEVSLTDNNELETALSSPLKE